MMNFEPANKPLKRPNFNSPSNGSESPATSSRPRNLSDAPKPSPNPRPHNFSDTPKPTPSPIIPVIRTQKPSPTDSESSNSQIRIPRSANPDSPHGRNWAQLATFMRTQREKGFAEIRAQKDAKDKTVRFDTPPSRGDTSSPLPMPRRPSEPGSRPSSPASGRNSPATRPPRSRYTEDEDWSRRPRPKMRDPELIDHGLSKVPRKPELSSKDSLSPALDVPGRRRHREIANSPLTFGARGADVKPYTNGEIGPPLIPVKDGKRERIRNREDLVRKDLDLNGVGLGIHGHGIRERAKGVEHNMGRVEHYPIL